MHCDDETLATLALGVDEVDGSDAQHVRDCTTCQQALDELQRTATFFRHPENLVTIQQPSPQVWSRILDDVAATPVATSRPRMSRRRAAISVAAAASAGIAAAASIGIVIAIGIDRFVDNDVSASSRQAPPVTATADLRPVNGGELLGEAKLLKSGERTELQVDAPSQTVPAGYLEVWLLNEDGTRMISIGVLDDGDTHLFAVPEAAVDNGYVIVDISREQFDDDSTHSGDSTMRGRLEP